MTDRSRQGIFPPKPIPWTDVERERLRVLKIIAQRLPALAARRDVRMIGKGGTMLTLAEGLTRPSTDYDADTDKPIGKQTLVGMMKQILSHTPGVREPKVSWTGKRNDSVEFEWHNADRTITADSFLNTTVRTRETTRPQAWRLTEPEIDDATVHVVDAMPVYTMPELMRGKASAFMGRGKGRDTYDTCWALATRLEDVEPETRIALDRFMATGTTDLQWKQWYDNYRTDPIMVQSNMDEVMETIITCLEKDPVVRCAREPDRGLGFWVDGDRNTVALVLPKQGDQVPQEKLLEVPRNAIEEIARFVLDSGADLSHRLKLGPQDIRREGTGGLTRILENGVAGFERTRAKTISG